jgi:hypothetical protein
LCGTKYARLLGADFSPAAQSPIVDQFKKEIDVAGIFRHPHQGPMFFRDVQTHFTKHCRMAQYTTGARSRSCDIPLGGDIRYEKKKRRKKKWCGTEVCVIPLFFL